MENEFAQYCLKRLELLEKENVELKAKIKLLEENSKVNRSNFLYYTVFTYSWYINKTNYEQFEKALTDWDYNWLSENGFRINSALADYEISIGDKTYYFGIEISPEGAMTFRQLDLNADDLFDSYLAAKEGLIKVVKEKIAMIKEEIAKNAKTQAE